MQRPVVSPDILSCWPKSNAWVGSILKERTLWPAVFAGFTTLIYFSFTFYNSAARHTHWNFQTRFQIYIIHWNYFFHFVGTLKFQRKQSTSIAKRIPSVTEVIFCLCISEIEWQWLKYDFVTNIYAWLTKFLHCSCVLAIVWGQLFTTVSSSHLWNINYDIYMAKCCVKGSAWEKLALLEKKINQIKCFFFKLLLC